MCLGMNPDKLDAGRALRHHLEPQFRGPPGPGGRTHLCRPAMAAAAAVTGQLDRRARSSAEGGQRMDKFTTLTGVAAPLPLANVDTDKIIPARFLKTIKRTGFGKHLFDDAALSTPTAREHPDFVLNQAAYRHAQILIARENFGCGSSREHAPWALLDFGIRCVIAPSFADIFHNNCFKNGILPIRLPRAICDQLMDDAEKGGNARMTVDLERQVIVRPNGEEIPFEIDPFRKHLLLNGLDDIGQTMQHARRSTPSRQTQRRPTTAGLVCPIHRRAEARETEHGRATRSSWCCPATASGRK